MANVINWFEIPAADFDRAKEFYSKVLDAEFHQVLEMLGVKMAFFPMEGDGVGGSICSGKGYKPSADGTLVYFNGGEDLSIPLSRVEDAGGKMLMPKTKISDDIGFMAIVLDTEGNKIAFHSPK